MRDWTQEAFVLFAVGPPPAFPRRTGWEPAYKKLGQAGLAERAAKLTAVYRACRLCPRYCGVDRFHEQKGVCGGAAAARVASWHAHFGEERPLVGRGGSGTIFFSRCNLLCDYCQNWTISHGGEGRDVSDDELARIMLDLQTQGCHNINLVTPTHQLPNIVAALETAAAQGLRLPLVYNCSGYEAVDVLRLLDGVVDIYLPDFKYMDSKAAARYSRGACDYPEVCAAAVIEMYRQVGSLLIDEDGVALRGLMIRHLVLPENKAGTDRFVLWVANNIGAGTYVNLMAQYRPAYLARLYTEINRTPEGHEYARVLEWARDAGLRNVGPLA
jgi:putative pyruvate formate lyase activating enzyme